MPLTNFRTSASWRAAVSLGPALVRLAEELPASEQLGLAWQVQQTMVELPAAIAFDLQEPDRTTRIPVMLRLVAALDLIERVYPALDTAAVRQAADSLIERLGSDQFNEPAAAHPRPAQATSSVQHVVPAPEHLRGSVPWVADTSAPEPHTVVPAPVQPEAPPPAPAPVPAPAPAPPPRVIIAPPPAAPAPAPQPDQDDHVHPDSSQQA